MYTGAGRCRQTNEPTWSAWPSTSSVFALRATPRHVRNPFSVEKMKVTQPGRDSPEGAIIYHARMNEKIHRNFEVFSPCDFIAAITPCPAVASAARRRKHIPDKSFQLVRYYGGYSNKVRGQRLKRAAEDAKAAGVPLQVIALPNCPHRRIPSAKWRELIKKVWEADPLMCPRCQKEMRIVSLIDDRSVIERILRHLGLWVQGVRVSSPARAPPTTSVPSARIILEPMQEDPFPDYDAEPVTCHAEALA